MLQKTKYVESISAQYYTIFRDRYLTSKPSRYIHVVSLYCVNPSLYHQYIQQTIFNMTSPSIMMLYLFLLYGSALTNEKCNMISVQCQCVPQLEFLRPVIESETSTLCHLSEHYACCDSLDDAFSFIEHKASLCQNQLRAQVNMTFITTGVNLTRNVTFYNTNFSQLLFLGAPNQTQIQCKAGSAAIKFDGSNKMQSSMEVIMQNITFISCGLGTDMLPAAFLFFGNCQIEMSGVRVENSSGSGLLLVNVWGIVNVMYSSFIGNKVKNVSGGGVHITLSFGADETQRNPHYNFTSCEFNNSKLIGYNYDAHASGGGLFVTFMNHTNNSHVVVQNCIFSGNSAHWGAGLLGKFDDNATNNSLSILSTTFSKNHGNETGSYTAGAGVMINFFSNSKLNLAYIHDCNFIENVATWGGGLELYSLPTPQNGMRQNRLIVSQCQFSNNFANNGAAINIYCLSPVTSQLNCNVKPVLSNSNFTHNGNTSLILPNNKIIGSIICINHFPTTLRGKLNFFHNYGSPLHVHETSAYLSKNTVLHFYNNTAQNGGAIVLYGSWIAVSNSSEIIFSHNTAHDKGGAVYAYSTIEAFVPYVHRCFVRFYTYNNSRTPSVVLPWKSNASFTFINNTPEAIYTTSILPCVWHHNNTSTLDQDIRDTFCSWKNWNFSGSCANEIRTAARNFSTTPENVTMFPGIPDNFVRVVDDLGNNMSNFIINAKVLSTGGEYFNAQFLNEELVVHGPMNTNVNVLLELEGDRSIFKKVHVSLQDCPPGFSFENNTCICSNSTNHFYCEHKSEFHQIAYLIVGFCTSYSQVKHKEFEVLYGRCPFTAEHYSSHNFYSPYLLLPLKKENLNEEFCEKYLKRRGKLCGYCMENYSINVLSETFDCYNCSGSATEWLLFATVEGLLPLIFFVMVLLLHISFTSGPLNGFIFCSQVLTVSLEVIVFKSAWIESSIKHPKIISGTVVSLYSIWSLDFLRLIRIFNEDFRMCLGPQLKVIHVLALRYLSAIYPLCFLMVAYIVIELHARNCRILVWLWKPLCFLCTRFRQAWKARTSIVDAFAAFILLSYVKVVRLSMVLLTFSDVYNSNFTIEERVVNYDPTVKYLGSEHAPFAAIGAFFLLTFGLTPPLLLTFYQFKIVQKCLNRCKLNRSGLRIFMDAFQGCYKDGKDGGPDCRYFAGLYFFFRLIVFAIFDLTTSLSLTYIELLAAFVVFGIITAVVQPYKKQFYTCLDLFFFNTLAFIMGLHVYALLALFKDPHPVMLLIILFTLTTIPLVYMILFVLFWLCQKAPKCIKKKVIQTIRTPLTHTSQPDSNQECNASTINLTDSIPDRLVNSFRYRKLTLQNVFTDTESD